MKLRPEEWREMVSGPNGQISSTRVLAWDTWVFTKRVIIVFLVLALGLTFAGELITDFNLSHQTVIYLLEIMGSLLLMLFLAIYAPKQFAKMSETKAIFNASAGNSRPKEQ